MAQESWKREEEAGCQPPEGPVLCTNNCGFFGSVATMNMCSKCYRELITLKQSKAAAAAATSGIDMASFKKAGMDSSRISSPPSPPAKVTVTVAAPDGQAKVTSPNSKTEAASSPKAEVQVETPPQAAAAASAPKELSGAAPSAELQLTAVAAVAVAAASAAAGNNQDGKRPPPNRCFSCRKRLGLTGFKCRCGDTFCSMHRYSDKHQCTFDYKAAGREAIAKANPLVKADKVEKI